MTDASTGKRAAKRQRTQSDLAAAAIRLFEEYGFDDISVDEIADAAGVSRRTLFRHFPTKADIVFADHPERIRRLAEYLDASSPSSSPLEVVLSSALATIPSFADPADFFLARHRLLKSTPELLVREQAYGLQYTSVLSRFLRGRLVDLDIPAADIGILSDTLGAGVVTVVNRAQRRWSSSNGEIDMHATTTAGLDVLRRAFGPMIDGQVASPVSPTVIVMNSDGETSDVVERLHSIFDRT